MRSWRLLLLVLVLALVAAACGDDDGGAGGDSESEPAASEPAGGGEEPSEASEEPSEDETEDGAAGESSDLQAAIVTDVGGLGDQSFNDAANAGLEAAAEGLGIETQVLESAQPTDYVNNLSQLGDNGFSPIFAVGFLMTDALTEVAPNYPEQDFAIIDSVVEADNVASLLFREEQGSYLAGIVAGLMTQEDTEFTTADDMTVGFLGGLEGELIQKFEAGYTAGVESVCPDCEVLVQYAGTTPEAFNDPARGNEIALSMNDDGADIVYHASGATGNGLFEAATERNFFAIGVDSDQASLVPDAPILTSMLKRVDVAVQTAIEDAAAGEFPAGEVITNGLAEEGVDLAGFGEFSDLVPEEVMTAVDDARQGIIDGEIEVPTTPGG